MRIPRKITPDGLTDAVVAVRYSNEGIPPEVLFGDFYRVLRQAGFTYVPPDRSRPGPRSMFFNETGVSAEFKPGLLWFNGILPAITTDGRQAPGLYIGWKAYRQVLSNVLEPLLTQGIVPEFTEVVVRYINILPWAPLTEQLRVAPMWPLLEGMASAPAFEYRLNWPPTPDGFMVRLRLTDKLPDSSSASNTGTLFDVEITQRQSGSSFEELQRALDATHQKQKEVFFNLLAPDFLNTLQPEYDSTL